MCKQILHGTKSSKHEEEKASYYITLLLDTKTLAYRMEFRCVILCVKSLRLFNQGLPRTLSTMDLPFNQSMCKKILTDAWTKYVLPYFFPRLETLCCLNSEMPPFLFMQGRTEWQFITAIAMIPYGYAFSIWAKQNLAKLTVNYYNFVRRTFSDNYPYIMYIKKSLRIRSYPIRISDDVLRTRKYLNEY